MLQYAHACAGTQIDAQEKPIQVNKHSVNSVFVKHIVAREVQRPKSTIKTMAGFCITLTLGIFDIQ